MFCMKSGSELLARLIIVLYKIISDRRIENIPQLINIVQKINWIFSTDVFSKVSSLIEKEIN